MANHYKKIETLDEAYTRLICKALNSNSGKMKLAYPLLAPEGVPSLKTIYRIKERNNIKKVNGLYQVVKFEPKPKTRVEIKELRLEDLLSNKQKRLVR